MTLTATSRPSPWPASTCSVPSRLSARATAASCTCRTPGLMAPPPGCSSRSLTCPCAGWTMTSSSLIHWGKSTTACATSMTSPSLMTRCGRRLQVRSSTPRASVTAGRNLLSHREALRSSRPQRMLKISYNATSACASCTCPSPASGALRLHWTRSRACCWATSRSHTQRAIRWNWVVACMLSSAASTAGPLWRSSRTTAPTAPGGPRRPRRTRPRRQPYKRSSPYRSAGSLPP
mmetsp:Transcript_1131/g.2447  ORF Transcript_1131/g.2447 Transcript_1131/m.2447 type:complete len:234 (+) Transcript_1131:569-1270(+)